jgi:hypothetical protein
VELAHGRDGVVAGVEAVQRRRRVRPDDHLVLDHGRVEVGAGVAQDLGVRLRFRRVAAGVRGRVVVVVVAAAVARRARRQDRGGKDKKPHRPLL